MASVNLSLAVVVALFSGFVILGAVVGENDQCTILCGTYVTCDNYPGQMFAGCICTCAPTDGHGCIIHGVDGNADVPCNN